ncbi:MAG: transglycosylase domain-containing protein [Acidobacteria bacterium]|nr:transglycosylase domain-containing protein [Acidobacteriota bacterium]
MHSVVHRRRKYGGSTITQQLVRTLFIADPTKLVRRKLVEITLALWFHRVCTKPLQLELYLASVRFDAGIAGLPAAIRYFFGSLKKSLSSAEAFFLIERISNIHSRLLVEKIDQMIRAAVAAELLKMEDVTRVIELYDAAVRTGKIKDSHRTGIERLHKAWQPKAMNPSPQV